jgi:tetratricopeptide (TPR) repeat protein
MDIDYVVLGEGEYAFLHLVEALEDMDPREKVSTIPGLALRIGDDIVRTAAVEPVSDLDSLPSPAKYFDFQHLAITRGCPGRCSFCGSPQFWGRRVRAHSATYFVDQLILLAQRGGRFFYFSDDTFTLDSDLVIEICRKIIEAGLDIRWQAISRVSAVNDRMLSWMRKAGCVQISYGVESGSERIRRLLCKDIGTRQIEQAFALTTAHGILARAYFIYGAPTESWRTIEQSLELIRKIRPLSAIFYVMTLFPGTALYDDFKERTGIDDDIWLQRIEDILYFEHDPEMDQTLVRDFGRHLRNVYHQLLPGFAQQIELKKDSDSTRHQAGFLSRLGMTFSHGDYAAINAAIDTSQIALELYKRALGLYPDHRAYWGMAMVYQRKAQWDQAIDALNAGLAHFPTSEALALCMGVSLMHTAQYRQALEYLLPHAHSKQAVPYIERCRRELDRTNANR